jgi:hypothetical protein
VRVKNPKERRAGTVVVIDVFETGGHTCPVKAFEKWSKLQVRPSEKPLFAHENGKPLTGQNLNIILKSRTSTFFPNAVETAEKNRKTYFDVSYW